MKVVRTRRAWRQRNRPMQEVEVTLPVDVIAALEAIAGQREMTSYQALISFYIGVGLRRDLSRLFYDEVLTATAEALDRHYPPEQVQAILREIGALGPTDTSAWALTVSEKESNNDHS